MAKAIDSQTINRVRRDYFQPWNFSCPVVGDIADADCLWVFAFGRNTYTDSELGAAIEQIRNNTGHDDLESIELLWIHGFDAGRPNLKLGQEAAEIMHFRDGKIPMIAQFEVPAAMRLSDPEWVWTKRNQIFPFWPPTDKPYFSTVDGMQECIRISQKLGCKKPAIIAHKAMLVRTLAIAWKMGISPIIPIQDVTEFDSKSVQSGPANETIWIAREIIARYVHHPLKGMVSLSPPRSGD